MVLIVPVEHDAQVTRSGLLMEQALRVPFFSGFHRSFLVFQSHGSVHLLFMTQIPVLLGTHPFFRPSASHIVAIPDTDVLPAL